VKLPRPSSDVVEKVFIAESTKAFVPKFMETTIAHGFRVSQMW